jgi:hypothetical protein
MGAGIFSRQVHGGQQRDRVFGTTLMAPRGALWSAASAAASASSGAELEQRIVAHHHRHHAAVEDGV